MPGFRKCGKFALVIHWRESAQDYSVHIRKNNATVDIQHVGRAAYLAETQAAVTEDEIDSVAHAAISFSVDEKGSDGYGMISESDLETTDSGWNIQRYQ